MRTLIQALLTFLLTVVVGAQEPRPAAPAPSLNPLVEHTKSLYGGAKHILIGSAEKMPEKHYSFKPAKVVRTYGEIIGHVADSQYAFCSSVRGDKNPAPKIEKTKTTKADLVAALKEAFAYCDKAYDGMTDASATQMVKLFGGDAPKLGVLSVNSLHSVEHYGNLVTYMRLKGIVPPSSENTSR